jgi:hypothetical protein
MQLSKNTSLSRKNVLLAVHTLESSSVPRHVFRVTLGFYTKWWAYLDLNQGPRPYQGRALTN